MKPPRPTIYDNKNLEAAELILSNPQKHGGMSGFPWVWAVMFMQRRTARFDNPRGLQANAGQEVTL